MSADRVLTKRDAPPAASPELKAERRRVMGAVMAVIDDCLRDWEVTKSPEAEALVRAFGFELAALSKFVRTGQPLAEFLETRALPVAEEVAGEPPPTT